MNRIHIVGRKNSGKTTLIVDIVQHLTAQGYRIGTIKHTYHDHELDTPGKDSHRHREAGSAVIGILSRGTTAVFHPAPKDTSRDESRYRSIAPMFSDCDVVIVEGDLNADAPRIEVWRQATMQTPICTEDPSIIAIISDDCLNVRQPIWERSEVSVVAQEILRLVHLQPGYSEKSVCGR